MKKKVHFINPHSEEKTLCHVKITENILTSNKDATCNNCININNQKTEIAKTGSLSTKKTINKSTEIKPNPLLW